MIHNRQKSQPKWHYSNNHMGGILEWDNGTTLRITKADVKSGGPMTILWQLMELCHMYGPPTKFDPRGY